MNNVLIVETKRLKKYFSHRLGQGFLHAVDDVGPRDQAPGETLGGGRGVRLRQVHPRPRDYSRPACTATEGR